LLVKCIVEQPQRFSQSGFHGQRLTRITPFGEGGRRQLGLDKCSRLFSADPLSVEWDRVDGRPARISGTQEACGWDPAGEGRR
jgi:hypothetical protein